MATWQHSLAVKMVNTVSDFDSNDTKDLRYKRMVLGAESIIINVSASILIFSLAWILNVVLYSFAILIGFNVLRQNAFGLHGKTHLSCAIGSTLLFVIAPFAIVEFSPIVSMTALTAAVIYSIIMLVLWKYAPADTEARPIVGELKRRTLKRRSLVCCLVLATVLVAFPWGGEIRLMATLGSVYLAVAVLPVTYRVLGRGGNNYIKYELESKNR